MSAVVSFPRAMPANIEAEQALLGALLVNNEVLGAGCAGLEPGHFTEEIHRRVYDITRKMILAGQRADARTIKTFLGDHVVANGLGTAEYLVRLVAEAAPPIAAKSYAQVVRDIADRRSIIGLCLDTIEVAYDTPVTTRPAMVASELLTGLGAVIESGPEASTRHDVAQSSRALIERVRLIREGGAQPDAFSTGFTDLDQATGGFEAGCLFTVAAATGVGKTIFAVNAGLNVARKGVGVALFSLEVPHEQMTARILASMAYTHRRPIGFGDILRGRLDDMQMWLVEDAQKRLAKLPFTLECASSPTLAQVTAAVRAEKKRMEVRGLRLGVVLIDYLQLMRATDRYQGNRVYEVGEITKGLKALARDESVCVVMLSQINRGVDARDDKRPQLSDLRDSGSIEQDSDVVAFLFREVVYIEKSAKFREGDHEATEKAARLRHHADIILGKNRAGPTTSVAVWCNVQCSVMDNADKREAF